MSGPALYRVPAWHSCFARVRWEDADMVHKRVMRLLPEELAGEGSAERGRAGAHVLFRVELQADQPYVLLQSDVAPVDTSLDSRLLQPFLDALQDGRQVRFRVDLNAVRMQSRTRKLQPVPLGEVPQWVPGTRLGEGLADIEVGVPGEFEVRKGKGGTPVRVVRLDGRAVVQDAEAARRLVREGVGRARSYGCGLLSVAPAG